MLTLIPYSDKCNYLLGLVAGWFTSGEHLCLSSSSSEDYGMLLKMRLQFNNLKHIFTKRIYVYEHLKVTTILPKLLISEIFLILNVWRIPFQRYRPTELFPILRIVKFEN